MDLSLDLRHTLRSFRRRPGFALLVVLVLALGLGANALVFSVVDTVLLRPLPLPDSDELVQLWAGQNWFTPAEVEVFFDHEQGIELAGYFQWAAFGLTGSDVPKLVEGAYVSSGYFELLGVQPVAGRWFRHGEDRPGGAPVAVIAEDLWRTEFGADPDLLGQVVRMDGEPVEVVGVAPEFLKLPRADAKIWRPLILDADDEVDYNSRYVQVIGRVDPEANAPDRRLAELVGPRVSDLSGDDYAAQVGAAVPLRDVLVGEVRPTLIALLVAVGAVLLVVTVNVANLLLARAAGRRRELAVRSALGCERRRLVGLLAWESLTLAAAGGVLGTALAAWTIRRLPGWLADQLPRTAELAPDVRLVWVGAALSLLTGVLFGALPAWRMSRADLFPSLREGAAGSLGRSRLHGALVVAEVALAFVLVASAALVGRSFIGLLQLEPGFESSGVVTFLPILGPSYFEDFDSSKRFTEQLEAKLEAMPGVEAVGANHMIPVAAWGFNGGLILADRQEPETPPIVNWRTITPGYFDAMGIPLLRGRAPSDADDEASVEVAWVNRAFVDQHLSADTGSGTDAIGRRFRHSIEKEDQWVEVAGIVGDVHQHGLENDAQPEVYRPLAQVERPVGMAYFLRTSGDPRALYGPIRDAVAALDRDVAVSRLETMDEVVWASITRPRLTAGLFAGFAMLTLLLAAVGIYGVVAYEVGQRIREIGLRMALGSDRRAVVGLIVGQTLRRTLVGLALGLGLALVGGRWLASLLFRVDSRDPVVLVVVAALLCAVATVAALRPALRAAGVDPLEALRQE